MHITCKDCLRHWDLACPECAEEKAERHRNQYPEHSVSVSGVDKTSGSKPFDLSSLLEFPEWIRGKKNG